MSAFIETSLLLMIVLLFTHDLGQLSEQTTLLIASILFGTFIFFAGASLQIAPKCFSSSEDA